MKKLKKKKGFTLVELIVVIAIIGVLAAILIPTMMGYVVSSNVSNANAAASKMRENISYFLTKANTEGYGMFISQSAVCDCDVTVLNGKWTITTNNKDAFACNKTTKWSGSGSGTMDDQPGTGNAETELAIYLARLFRDVDSGHAEFKLVGGVCFALYFTVQTTDPVTEIPGFGDGQPWSVEKYEWNKQHQGVTPSGYVVGTSPVLIMA